MDCGGLNMTHKRKKQENPHPDPLSWAEWNVISSWVTICSDLNGDDCERCPSVVPCCRIWDFLNDYIDSNVTFEPLGETEGKGEQQERQRYDPKLLEEILKNIENGNREENYA